MNGIDERIIIYPTDTVWGIGASIFSKTANTQIRKLKGKEDSSPLGILFLNFETIEQFFNLPESVTKSWLLKFFELQTSLLLPRKLLASDLPDNIQDNCDFISFRYLPDVNWPIDFIDRMGGAITSTSLNLTGEAPILDSRNAREFSNKYLSEMNFLFLDLSRNIKPDAQASTMVKINDGNDNDSNTYEILRNGTNLEEIKAHCNSINLKQNVK
jgi:L-threonylcarbamoyladenylate synthase